MGFEDRIYAVLSQLTPWPLVIADQNAPRLTRAHGTVLVVSRNLSSNSEQLPGDQIIEDRTRTETSVLVRVNFFGPGANTAATLLGARLNTNIAYLLSFPQKCSVGNIDQVRDLTGLIDPAIKEERSVLEFDALFALSMEDNFGTIDAVVIEGEYQDGDGHAILPAGCTHVITKP